MQRKSLGIACCLVLLGLILPGLVGCNRAVLPPPPPHQGAVVRVACPADVPAEVVRRHARVWSARQQASVEVVRYDPKVGPNHGPPADVWIVRPAELPHWASTERLLPVPDDPIRTAPAYDWMSLLPLYRDQLLLWDRIPYGVPLLGESTVLVYRSDLFNNPALQAEYQHFLTHGEKKTGRPARELRRPETWEEFADQAEFFRRHHPSGKEGPSLPPLPTEEGELDRLFYQVAAPHVRRAVREDEVVGPEHLAEVFAFHYDLKTGQPRLATPGFVYSLDLLKRLQACRPLRPSAHPAEALATGQAVLGLVDASWLPRLQKKSQNPDLRDQFSIGPIPGAARLFDPAGKEVPIKGESNRVPYLGGGGWLAVVPVTAANPEAAWSLLAELTGPALSNQTVAEASWGGGAIRQEQLHRERWDGFDLDADRVAALRSSLARNLALHGLKNPVLCLRTPDQEMHRKALVKEVRRALEGTTESRKALEEAVRRWKDLDAKKGPAALAEYRVSLGLLPD